MDAYLNLSKWARAISVSSLWGWLGGRHFVLAAFFSATAFVLAWHGLLTKEYAGTIVAIQGFMTWRTMHEDKKEVALANGNGNGHGDGDNGSNGAANGSGDGTGSAGDKG